MCSFLNWLASVYGSILTLLLWLYYSGHGYWAVCDCCSRFRLWGRPRLFVTTWSHCRHWARGSASKARPAGFVYATSQTCVNGCATGSSARKVHRRPTPKNLRRHCNPHISRQSHNRFPLRFIIRAKSRLRNNLVRIWKHRMLLWHRLLWTLLPQAWPQLGRRAQMSSSGGRGTGRERDAAPATSEAPAARQTPTLSAPPATNSNVSNWR